MGRIVLFVLTLSLLFVSGCREQSKEELLQQGRAFADSGKPQAAIGLFREALEKDPNYLDARLELGLAYLAIDKLDKAESELKKVLRQAPENRQVSLHLAQVYLATDRPAQAIDQLTGFPKTDPAYAEALQYLARAHAMQGNAGIAEDLFLQSLELRPDHTETQLMLARLLLSQNRSDESLALVNDVIKQDPQETEAYYVLLRKAIQGGESQGAMEALENIRAIDAEDQLAAYLLGMLYLDSGNLQAARPIATDLIKKYPDHPAGYRVEGVLLYQSGDYQGAIERLQRSILGMPDLAGYYFLGLANYQHGQYELAISSFQKALDEMPDHVPSRLMVAQTLLRQGRLEDGIRQVRRVLNQDPTNANAHNILASAYMLQGRYDPAMEHLEKAIELNPSLPQVHLKKGFFNLAAGRKNQAEIDLSNAVNIAPEILNNRLLLATYYLRMHNYPKAIELLNEGLAVSSDNAVIYNFLAAAQLGQNKPEAAVKSLEKAKSLEPEFFTPYFNLANYYVNRKDYEAALAEYEAVLRINPNQLAALFNAATLLEYLGRNEQAETYYQKAAESQTPEGYLALAHFQQRSKKRDEALKTLEAGYKQIPDHPQLLMTFGQALRSAERYDDAIAVYIHLEEMQTGSGKPFLLAVHLEQDDLAAAKEIAERAIAEEADGPQGYLLQTAIHEYLSEWSQAEETLQKGLAATDGSPVLKFRLARLYGKRGAFEDALEIYDSLLAEEPDSLRALFGKASVLDVLGNKKKAQNLYERILDLDETYVPALNNLAYLLLEVYADYTQALELAARGFRLQPRDPRIIDTLGYALLKNGRPDDAIIFLEKAASLLPGEAAVQIHLAEAYKAAGRNDEAVASLVAIEKMDVQESELEKVRTLQKSLN